MKKINLPIIFIFIFSVVLYAQELDNRTLYEKILEYYELAQEEYEKGEYVKSYEYSQMANELILQLDSELFLKTIDLILNPLKADVEKGLEDIKQLGNESIEGDYNIALDMYNNAVSYHDEANKYDAKNMSMAKNVFVVARNNYESALVMIEYINKKSKDVIDKSEETESVEVSVDLINKANSIFMYVSKNNILMPNSKGFGNIEKDINSMNNYKKNNDDKNANKIANEVMPIMTAIAQEYESKKLINYANMGMKKAMSNNKNINDDEDYQNIEKMVDEAKKLYNEEQYKESLYLLSKSILSLKDNFNVFKELPKTYRTVYRRSPIKTDSFWNIAGYDYIYGNTQLWATLYEANKNKIANKNNPRLIYPNTVLNIPSIIGEDREGLYNSNNMYIPVLVYYYLEEYKRNTDNDSALIIETNDDDIAKKEMESGIKVESIGDNNTKTTNTSEQYKNDEIIEKYTEEDNYKND